MNPFFQQVIIDRVSKKLRKRNHDADERIISAQARQLQVRISHFISEVIFIVIGIVSAGFGLKGFLLPSSFIDGGVTGISLLTSEVTGLSLSILIVAINLPFIILGYSQVGKEFAIKSMIAIIGLALAVHFIPYPVVTTDKLLIAVFGGFFLGAGIGLAIRGGAVLDGTEVLAIYFSKKTGLTIGDVILIFNIIIFSFGAYILTIEIALYAILTYMAASKTVDFVIEGIEEYTGVTIISDYSEDVRLMITGKLERGVTIYNGKGGYGKKGTNLNKVDIIFTVITRLEIARLRTEIDKIDSNAFIIMSSIKDTKGGMIKKRPLEK
jgi:uncharacterized membrane-anchored protein YitT (DUF2179 family)